jgi:hypothetical protein
MGPAVRYAALMLVMFCSANVSAGVISGRVFNLNGAPIVGEPVIVQAVAPNGVVLEEQSIRNGSFSLDVSVDDPRINPIDTSINVRFTRQGQVTREVVGIFAGSDQTQVLDVTVPLPVRKCCCRCCRRVIYYYKR